MISKALEKLAQKYGLSFREEMSMSGVYVIYFPDSSIFGVIVRYDRDNERLSYSDDSYTMLDYALSFHENKANEDLKNKACTILLKKAVISNEFKEEK